MTEATAGAAPGRRRVMAGLVVLAWCLAVGVAATAAWVVVDRAGISLLGGSGPGVGGVGAGTATSTASSSATAGPNASIATRGGRVTGSCTPTGRISLGGAIPATGWTVEVKERGPQRLRVEFRSGSRKVEVEGVCRAGAAVLTQEGSGRTTSSTGPVPASSTSEDHGGRGSGGGGSSTSGSDDGGSHGGSGSGASSASSGSGGSGGSDGSDGSGKDGSGSGSSGSDDG